MTSLERSKRRACCSIFALLATLAAPHAFAQKKPTAKAPLVFGSDIALVQVPVFVSGRDGGAATGLTETDFIVEEDGRKVDIVSFRRVDTTAIDDQDDIRRTSAARRRFLLLFDKSFTDASGLVRARKAAKDFVLNGLAASDLAAVATYDFLHGIRLVANFTEDRRVLEHAIHTLGTPSLSKVSDPLAIAADFQATDLMSERSATDASNETPQALVTGLLAVLVRQMQAAEEQSYRDRARVLVEGFRELGHSLQRIPGRKQILYFSTGFNSTLLTGQDVAEQRRMSEALVAGRIWEVDGQQRYGDASFRSLMDEALLSLTRSDSVIHSIDLSGIGRAENYAQLPSDVQPMRDASGRESLALIAEQTGGRFFKDANDLGPVLREMGDLTSRYYVLGVQPQDGGSNGEFRKLKVRVKPRGLRVSHRPGFFERSSSERPAPTLRRQFEAAELLTSVDETVKEREAAPFGVLIIPVPADSAKQSLGIVVQVPREKLVNSGTLELFGYATAKDGSVLDHFAHFLRLDQASGAGEGSARGISFAGRFDVPPGEYSLRFLVQHGSRPVGSRFFEVTVPERAPAQGFLLPPLFADRPEAWVRVALKSREGGELPFPLGTPDAAFLPRTEISLTPGRRERIVLFAYDPKANQDPATDLDIRTVLSDAAGRRFTPGQVGVERVRHDGKGQRSYVLSLVPGELPPGDYTLRVHIGEAGSVLESYCRLTVLAKETAFTH